MEKQSKEDNKTTDASSLTEEALAIAEQMLTKKGKDFHDEDLNEVTEEMVKKAEKEFLVNDKKKRKIEEIEK